MNIDDIISYSDIVSAEGQNIQRGMNFNVGNGYSVFLMSVRKNAPYADKINEATNSIVYEGHDAQKNHARNPKDVDQPMVTPKGSLTQNGKFFAAAQAFKLGLTRDAHKIKVYEKLDEGVWSYKGFFNLVDARIFFDGKRNVFKFYLQAIELKSFHRETIIPNSRLIPTEVKIEVWNRDRGRCVLCGSTENLHYDHDLPFSKGGTSYSAKNVRILCLKCNLKKSSKIMTIIPPLFS
ncbi:MAG TPA: HNH endonuclease signature motif containing protein [Candidatus Acidoferrales bacterium]|nr:HNH endonuclease signature motif containing protein [Candidatus Acidoferrales bacterium]